MVQVLTQPFRLGRDASVRIGIAHALPAMTAGLLLAEAEAALYTTKNAGKGCCVFAQPPQELAAEVS